MHTQLYCSCVCIEKYILISTHFIRVVESLSKKIFYSRPSCLNSLRARGTKGLTEENSKNSCTRDWHNAAVNFFPIWTLQLNISGSLAHSKFIIKIHMIKTLDKIKSLEDGDLIRHDSSSGSLFCSSKVNGRILHFLGLPSPSN